VPPSSSFYQPAMAGRKTGTLLDLLDEAAVGQGDDRTDVGVSHRQRLMDVGAYPRRHTVRWLSPGAARGRASYVVGFWSDPFAR
jgi:hypothetical protein